MTVAQSGTPIQLEPGTSMRAPSEECIARFERYYDVVFPGSYRAFVVTGNGAVPRQKYFDDRGNVRVLERFLALLDRPQDEGALGSYDVGVVLAQVEDRLVSDEELEAAPDLEGQIVVPFAALFAGDLLCFDFRANASEPPIILWDHEASEPGRPVFHRVADSFDALLARLRFVP